MAQRSAERAFMSDPMSILTEDILVDIISRLPYKSTACCKCVSRRWRDLISHPDHRKKLPQSLAGFFHDGYNQNRYPSTVRYFTNVSGEGYPFVDPSLSFLPNYGWLDILDCCNGLLLCRCSKPNDPETLDYVVCNPATQKWVVVPASDWSSKVEVARLGFEPDVSSHFHVFEFIDDEAWGMDESGPVGDGRIHGLARYSSKSGVWTHLKPRFMFKVPTDSKTVFLNGMLYLAADDCIVAVEAEGNEFWDYFDPQPPYEHYRDPPVKDVFISQRQLYFARTSGSKGSKLSIWTLGDSNAEEWTLKHKISHLELFGAWYPYFAHHFNVISFDPERNMMFMVCGQENMLMSYDMDCRKLCFICQLGRDCQVQWGKTPYIPYVPLYSEALADGH